MSDTKLSPLDQLAQDLSTNTSELEKIRAAIGLPKNSTSNYSASEIEKIKQVFEWKTQGVIQDYKEGAQKLKDLEKNGLVLGTQAKMTPKQALSLIPPNLVEGLRAAIRQRAQDFAYGDLVNASQEDLRRWEDEQLEIFALGIFEIYNEELAAAVQTPEFLKYLIEGIMTGKSSYQPSPISVS